MSYCVTNFKTKKELKEALANGRELRIFNPGLGNAPTEGRGTVEGPHYPQPHKWYAEVEMKNGLIVKVR